MSAAVERERHIVETFVALTDTLVSDFDALDLMMMLAERSATLLDISAAGVILSDGRGGLSVAAASSERSRLLEVFAVAIDAGPCVDCVRTGDPVTCEDFHAEPDRWPRFAAGAGEAGYRAVHALPMRLRGEAVGVLTLLHTEPHVLTDGDRRLGHALADAATVGLLSERAVRHAETITEHLQRTLNSRIIIEQAKGVLAAQTGRPVDDVFLVLRSYARSHALRLADVARDTVTGTLDLSSLTCPTP